MSRARQPFRFVGMLDAIFSHLKRGKSPNGWSGAVWVPSGRCRLWNQGPSAFTACCRRVPGPRVAPPSRVFTRGGARLRDEPIGEDLLDVALELRRAMGGGVLRQHAGARARTQRRSLRLANVAEVSERVGRRARHEDLGADLEKRLQPLPSIAD